MSINLSSSLSAITTDLLTGITHIVWAEDGNIWHAIYDENSENWINAQSIANTGIEPVTSLNLVSHAKLIDGSSPGLALVWQQGKLNKSDFYYTGARYDANRKLQWLSSPKVLTSDQFGDLEPTVSVVTGPNTNVVVIGSKVNFTNANNQSILEDTDLYGQIFSLSSSQFQSNANTASPQAEYSPQLSNNGLINLGVLSNSKPTQILPVQAVAPLGLPSGNLPPAPSSSPTIQATDEQPGREPIGTWNGQTYFESNLLEDWELMETVPANGLLRSIIKPLMHGLEIAGSLSGGRTWKDDKQIFIQTNAQLEYNFRKRFKAPWAIMEQNNSDGHILNGNTLVAPGEKYLKKYISPIKFGFDMDSSYSFYADSNNNLASMEDVVGVTLSIKIPGTTSAATGGFISTEIYGSVGVNYNVLGVPATPNDGNYSPKTLNALLATLGGEALGDSVVLLKALSSGAEGAAASALLAELALNLGQTVGAYIKGYNDGLNLSGSITFPLLSVGAEMKVQIPHVPILSLEISGGIQTTINMGLGDVKNTFDLSLPINANLRLGPIGLNFDYDPSWSWNVFDGNKDTGAIPTQAVAANAVPTNAVETNSSSTASVVAADQPSATTASLAGTLLTVDFGTNLDQLNLPSAQDFTVSAISSSGQSTVIPVFNVSAGSTLSTVVLQLEQAVSSSINYNYTDPTKPNQTTNSVQLKFINNGSTLDAASNRLPDFDNLNVTNLTPNTPTYSFNPISGNSQNYINPTLLLAFDVGLDANSVPDPSRFSALVGNKSYTPVQAQITDEGVYLTFNIKDVSNANLQNATISYDNSTSSQGKRLSYLNGTPVESFAVQNGLSVTVSQSYAVITNSNNTISLSNSITNWKASIIDNNGNPTNVGILQVALRDNNAVLSFDQNIAPNQSLLITYSLSSSQSVNVSSVVTAITPPAVSTQSLLSTVESDLGQDSSPILIQRGDDSSPLLAWVSDAPPLVPIAGFGSDTIIYLNFIGQMGNKTNVPDTSQFVVIDDNNNNYKVDNVSVEGNTLKLTLDSSVSNVDGLKVSYTLASKTDGSTIIASPNNLYISQSSSEPTFETKLWVSSFSQFSIDNQKVDTDSPKLLGAGSTIKPTSDNNPASNQIILVFDTLLHDNGVKNTDFDVYSNGNKFTVDQNVAVAANTVVLTVQPDPNSIKKADLIGSGDLVTVSYKGKTLSNDGNRLAYVNQFTNTPVTTSPKYPTTVIKYSFINSGSADNASNLTNAVTSIPNSAGLNFDPVAASSSTGVKAGTTVLIWSNASITDIRSSLTPGEFYTNNESTIINESFNQSNIYYSILDPSTGSWSLATQLAHQVGSEGKLAIAALDNGQFLAAWINYNNNISTIYTSNLTNSAGIWSWSNPQAINTDAKPDPLTELRIVSIDGNPTVLWTETQPVSYSELTQEESPLIYYRLAESTGTSLTNLGVFGAGANGNYNGTVSFNQHGALETLDGKKGDPNPAVLFHSNSSASSSAFPISRNSFSLEFWFQVPALPTAASKLDLLSAADYKTGTKFVDVQLTSNSLVVDFAGNILSSSNFNPLPNTWNYVVATYDGLGKIGSLYINGQPSASTSNLNLSLPRSAVLTLSNTANTQSIYLDEVAFYGKTLVYNEIPKKENFANLTSAEFTQLLFESNPIGNKYDSQYTSPLPPGPNTNYSTLFKNAWSTPKILNPLIESEATQLSNSNKPDWDLTSFSIANSSGYVNPNNYPDIFLPISLGNQITGKQIKTISVSAKNKDGQTVLWSLGNSTGHQLALVQGNKLINPRNPNGSFSYTFLSPDANLQLYVDPGTNVFDPSTSFSLTISLDSGDIIQQDISQVDPKSSAQSIASSQVLGSATVTEANDSSLALIDSGFIVSTNNANIGYGLVSADLNNDKKLDVIISNRGFSDYGTIQVLFGGGDVLLNKSKQPLSYSDLSGNPNGLLITNVADSGPGKGDLPVSLATGDINGDGFSDLVIGNPNENRVYVIYGYKALGSSNQIIDLKALTTAQGYVITAPSDFNSNALFGYSVAVGNFNSSAVSSAYAAGTKFDIAVGAPGLNEGMGGVYVYYDGGSESNVVYASSNEGELAGYSVAVSSLLASKTTFTGNRLSDDLIIGAIGYKGTITNNWNGLSGLPKNPSNTKDPYPSTSTAEIGAVYVLQSSVNTKGYFSPFATYTGPNLPSNNGTANDVNLGSSLYSGDLTGDSINDLVIAAPGDANNQGTIYVLEGHSKTLNSNTNDSIAAQNILNVANLSIVGGIPLSQTGTVITSPGDINDDKYNDLLITAPNAANGTGQNYLLFGPLDLKEVGKEIDLNVVADDSHGSLLLNGSQPYQLTGTAAAGIGDINSDGVADLLLTAPNAEQIYNIYGHPWLADDGSIKLSNISADNGFVVDGDLYKAQGVQLTGTGNVVVMLGDVNGDGFDDVIAGGSVHGAILTFGASTVDLLDNASGNYQLIISIANSGLIKSIFSVGDFNGDSFDDFGVLDSLNTFHLIFGNSNLSSQQSLTLNYNASSSIKDIIKAYSVGDFNGDGYDDLMLTNSSSSNIFLLGNFNGSISQSPTVASPYNLFASLGDINGDGRGDFAGSNSTGNGIAKLFYGNLGADTSNAHSVTLAPPAAYIGKTINTQRGTWLVNVDRTKSTRFNSAPSLAEFNGRLYMAYTGVANNSNNNGSPFVQWTTNGIDWHGNTNFQTSLGQGSSGISLTVYQDKLYAAWLSVDKSPEIVIAHATQVPVTANNPTGLQWSSPFVTNQSTGIFTPAYITPVIAQLKGTIYVFYATGGQNESMFSYISSTDGITWTQHGTKSTLPLPFGFLPLGASLAVTSDESNLYLSYAQATGNNTASAKNQVFAKFDGSSWTYNFHDPAPSRGSGLLKLGDSFYNFYLRNLKTGYTLDMVFSDPLTGSWSAPQNLEDITSDLFDQNWLTYPNPFLYQEKVYIGIGDQFTENNLVDVSYTNTKDHVFQPNLAQQFGQDLIDIGDFNGDGIADFGVLAPGYFSNLGLTDSNNQYQNNQGAVLVYYGKAGGMNTFSSPDLVFGTPPATSETNLAKNQAMLLSQVAAAGDVNGDGFDDLVIASPRSALNNNNTQDGFVFVVFGGDANMWGHKYPTISPYNLGNLSPITSQITLSFSSSLSSSSTPAGSAFTVTNEFSTVTVASVTINNNNPSEVILILDGVVNTSNLLKVSYTPPKTNPLLYASNNIQVKQFDSYNNANISTLGAPKIVIDTYPELGFQISGLPSSLAGISLDGAGDVNGDGLSDFLIGAPGNNDNLAYTLFGSDFNNTVNQTGTVGDDVMLGSPTGESFVAGQGNDVIRTDGGVDVVYAGPGNDYVTVEDHFFQRLDGGHGLDVLALQGYNGQSWDLTTLSPGLRLRDFEVVVTEGYGANTLTLNSVTVNSLSSTNVLTLIMDESDTLSISNDFRYQNTAYQFDRKFTVYQSQTSSAKLLISVPDTSLKLNLFAPAFNTPSAIIPSTTQSVSTFAAEPLGLANQTLAVNDVLRLNNIDSSNNIKTQLYVSNPTVSERSGSADFTVTRTGDLNQYTWAEYYTQDGDAKAGERYIPTGGQIVFAPGESIKVVSVSIPNNGKYVGKRQFGLAVELEGEATDPALVPIEWKASIASPKEQIRRWTLNTNKDDHRSLSFNVTSSEANSNIVTLDLDLKGTVTPQIWNPTKLSFQDIPFNAKNGINQMLDIDGDMINDLYRIRFEDGGIFDGDGMVNGLVNLTFDLVQLRTTPVPVDGGRIEGTEGNNYINAQESKGTNRLEGKGGTDILIGSPQRDVLVCGPGNDSAYGGAGIDQLYGESGDDLLDGGAGMNFLYGGDGADRFVLRAGHGPQRVMDFNALAGDIFQLENLTFKMLSFQSNQIRFGAETLAIVADQAGRPVSNFAANPGWFQPVEII